MNQKQNQAMKLLANISLMGANFISTYNLRATDPVYRKV
jgi:hypothetical protein